MGIIEKINDLIEQATKERSHYYTASVLKEARREIKQLKNQSNCPACRDYFEKSKEFAEHVARDLWNMPIEPSFPIRENTGRKLQEASDRWIDTEGCIICKQDNMKLGDSMDNLHAQIQKQVTSDDIFDVTIIMKKKG